MDAGLLRHRVTLQRPKRTQNPNSGALTTRWVRVATVWARVVPLSVRELLQSAAANSSVTARITIRWRADVDATMQVRHGGKCYGIVGVLPDPDSGREWLTMTVEEVKNNG